MILICYNFLITYNLIYILILLIFFYIFIKFGNKKKKISSNIIYIIFFLYKIIIKHFQIENIHKNRLD